MPLPAAPAAFRTHTTPAGTLVVHADFETAALALGLPDPRAVRARLADSGASGRGPTAILELPGRPETLHLRPVRHGGLLAPLWGDRVLGPARPLAELRVTASLRERGAPVPRPAWVLAWRARPLWQAVYATVHVEGAVDALAWLEGDPSTDRIARAAAEVGRAVRAFHDAGGRHADLHLKNLLIEEGDAGPRAWVIDLDKGTAGEAPDASRRMTELMRLYRSLLKRGVFARVGEAGREAFFSTYTAGDEALRGALLSHWPRERRRVARHARRYANPG